MIGCETARRLMDDRLDGEIGPVAIIDLEVHLGGCPACREIVSGLETLASGLSGLPLETMPDEDVDAVLARTIGRRTASDPETMRSRASFRRPRLVVAAAAAVLATAVVVPLVLRQFVPVEPSTAEVEQAAYEARMVLAVAARAVRSAETVRDRVIAREVSPALRRVPVRWSQVAFPRRNGA